MNGEQPKVLTVCEGGNVRSVCLMMLIKSHPFHPLRDVLAVGIKHSTPETVAFLMAWADVVLTVGQREIYDLVPPVFKPKVFHVDIGPDHWSSPMHPDLTNILREMLWHDYDLRKALRWPI